MNWREDRLGNVVTLKRGHDLPASARKDGSIPVVSSSGITGFHNVAKAEPPGVVTGRYGTLGEVFYINEPFWPLNTALYAIDFHGNNPRFVAYFLRLALRGTKSDKAAVPGINRNDLHERKVCVPEPTTQGRIVSILSQYDELIENNRRRITLLEEAARLIYREWFVHLRFPGHEHAKIESGTPDGWKPRRFGELLETIESGGRPSGGAKDSEGVPSVGAENVVSIGTYDFEKEKYVPEVFFRAMRRGIVQSRDVLLYKDGANIGRSSMFGDGFPHDVCAINEHVFRLRADSTVGQNWLYFWIEQSETRQRIANLNANSAQPGVSQEKLKTLQLLMPQKEICDEFNVTVEPLVAQIFCLARGATRLKKARDLLLPRLMSGEVEV